MLSEKIQSIFLEKYALDSRIKRRKAMMLFIMNTVVFSVVLLVPPIVGVIRGDAGRVLFIAAPIVTGTVISLIFLRAGSYNIAANITSLAAAVTIGIGVMIQHKGTPGIGFSSMVYLSQAVLIFTSLFCSRRWTTLLTLIFIGFHVFYYLLNKPLGIIPPAVLITGLIDSTLALIFTYSLAMLIIKTNRDAMRT